MLKRITILGLVFALLSVSAYVFAEDVYVTKRGKKFHKEDQCRFIKNKESEKIKLEESLIKGLTPCKRCFSEEERDKLAETAKEVSVQIENNEKVAKKK